MFRRFKFEAKQFEFNSTLSNQFRETGNKLKKNVVKFALAGYSEKLYRVTNKNKGF